MRKPKLGLRELNDPETLALTNRIITSMTGNSHFPVPNPPLTELTAIRGNINTLVTTIAGQESALKLNQTTLTTLFAQLTDKLTQEAAYVENIAAGDTGIIQSAGFEVSDEPQSVPLVAPANLQAIMADNEGEVKCKWNRVRGAKSYLVECGANPNGPWTQVTVTTKASHTAGGLASGTKYWFRVRAVGAEGFSPWSEPAVKMAA